MHRTGYTGIFITYDCNTIYLTMSNQPIQQINAKAFVRNCFVIKSNILLLFLCCLLTFSMDAQSTGEEAPSPTLNIGDAAPPLRVRQWLKGKPVKKIKKGKIYVIEFWATWCAPCRAAMPRLSALALQYKDKVTFLGIDVMEDKHVTPEKLQRFVDSMGQKMDYAVAADDNNFMDTVWHKSVGYLGMPGTIVVNTDGKIAWIGHPVYLADVLAKITSNNWDLKEALFTRKEELRLTAMDNDVSYDLMNYTKSENWAGSKDKPDSLLLAIDKILSKEPKLKFAPMVGIYTFSALLKTDMHKAYEYGKDALQSDFFGESPSWDLMDHINMVADSLPLTPEIYQLGIEACQLTIAKIAYPEITHVYKMYNKMAGFYWHINDPSKAIDAQQKAIASIKTRNDYTVDELAALETQLEKYRLMQKPAEVDSSVRN